LLISLFIVVFSISIRLKSMLKFSVVLLGVERVIFIFFIVFIFQSSPRRRLDQPHRGAGHPDLGSKAASNFKKRQRPKYE